MRMQVIINVRAGTVVGADVDTIAERVMRALEIAGHHVEAMIVKPQQLGQALERMRAERPDALVVGGGDGTIRFAAAAVLETPTALGVIPLGTINRLARDLGIPLDYEAAAAALATASIQEIDAGEVNGRLFLCNAFLGLTTRFSMVRQELRGKPVEERMRGYLAAVRDLLRSRRRITIQVDDGARAFSLRVLSLVVTNNAYSEPVSLAMRRPALDGGQLAIYASQHESGWRMIIAAIKVLFGRLATDQRVVQLTSSKVTVDVPKRRSVSLSIDGEVENLSTPLVFSIRPRALKVLVPRANG